MANYVGMCVCMYVFMYVIKYVCDNIAIFRSFEGPIDAIMCGI